MRAVARERMKNYGTFERYFVLEFYDDYRDGLIDGRALTRRVAFITGSMAAAAAAMAAVGCTRDEVPSADEPMPQAKAAAPTSRPTGQSTGESGRAGTARATVASVPEGLSEFSVSEDDPAITAADILVTSGGQEISGYLVRPAQGSPVPGILVCHENRGLVEHIRDVTRRFAKAGYAALALDLLSREGGTAAFDRDAVPGALTAAGSERHVADFTAAFEYLRNSENVDAGRIGMTGYCFGGGITWRTATAVADLKAAVPFYGPAPDLEDVPKINAAVLGAYAELDNRINAGFEALTEALVAAGTVHEMKVYPGVNHAFHNDTAPRYDEEQARNAWNDTLAWFERYL